MKPNTPTVTAPMHVHALAADAIGQVAEQRDRDTNDTHRRGEHRDQQEVARHLERAVPYANTNAVKM